MFFNRNYISSVPIREEQRLSEEEELARQLKREARIFFPDAKLPDLSTQDLPSLPQKQQETDAEQIAESSKPPESEKQSDPQLIDGKIGLRTGAEGKDVRPRLNIQDLKRGIRLKVVLDKPLGLMSWKEDNF